jgi:glucosylceramidase
MRHPLSAAFVLAALALAAVAAVPLTASAKVLAWTTEGDGNARLQPFAPAASTAAADAVVSVDAGHPGQVWLGVGAALTDSAATVIAAMREPERRQLVGRMFGDPGEGGAGFNLVRLTIGASDFSASGSYTYQSGPNQPIDVSHDLKAIVPMLRAIYAQRPDLKLLAAPWSPPAWMKTSGAVNGGGIKVEAYPALARYIAGYLRQYRAWGLPVSMVSPQNEPGNSQGDYPTALLPPEAEALFVHDHLAPELRRAGEGGTAILGLDHNWSDLDYARTLAASPAAGDLGGYAFHCYAGQPSAMASAASWLRPGQVMLMLECSPTRGSSFGQGFRYDMHTLVMGAAHNGASGVVMWNLALNPQGGPRIGGCPDCEGVATIEGRTVRLDSAYYALAQVSTAVRPGARVLPATTSSGEVEATAFRNPDGGVALIVYNGGTKSRRVQATFRSAPYVYTLAPNSALTLLDPPGA